MQAECWDECGNILWSLPQLSVVPDREIVHITNITSWGYARPPLWQPLQPLSAVRMFIVLGTVAPVALVAASAAKKNKPRALWHLRVLQWVHGRNRQPNLVLIFAIHPQTKPTPS